MDLQALETHSDTIAKVAVPLALVCWLAYLSVEQFYFFADNEQLISDLETSSLPVQLITLRHRSNLVRPHSIYSANRARHRSRRWLLRLKHD